MPIYLELELGSWGWFELAIPDDGIKMTWANAKILGKSFGTGYRLPLDFELEELFKTSLLRGYLKNVSYWSGTETAQKRARIQIYRNGGDIRANWFVNPGDIESKDNLNYFFFIRKSKKKNIKRSLANRILELALYDSIRQKYHINNYVRNDLNRSKVFLEYKRSNSSKKSFVSMLKWGQIRPANLNKVNAYKNSQLEKKLSAINELIKKKNAELIIKEYLSNNELKISGVNLSFITKHMYFLRPKKFIIYDGFMIKLHAAILLENERKLLDKFFFKSKNKLSFTIRDHMKGTAYADFLQRIDDLFVVINSELASRNVKTFDSKGEFEAFLFGEGNNRSLYNPRELINNFIKEKM
jgi:hypothetical protein